MSDDAPQGQQDVNTAANPSTAASSDVNKTSAAPSQQPSPDVNNKQSDASTDKGVKTEGSKSLKDMLSEGIDKMLGKDPAKAAPAAGEKAPDKQDAKTEGKVDGDEKVSDEEKNAPEEINKHPAFKKVVSERTAARAQVKELQSQLKVFETDAAKHQTMTNYLKENNVPMQQAAEAIKMTALAVKDPQAFYEKLVDMTQKWGAHLGHILPADLQKEVDEGAISHQRASELAKTRGQVTVAQHQVEQVNESTQQRARQDELNYRVQLFENWSGQVSRTDPDLQNKMPMIVERMKYLLDTEGDPGSPQKAWDRLNRVHKEVSDRLRKFVPAKTATDPAPQSQGRSPGPVTQPQNINEAWDFAFQKINKRA